MSISEEHDLIAQGSLKGWMDAADWLEEYGGQQGREFADVMRTRFEPQERPEDASAPRWALVDSLKAEYGGEDADWLSMRSLDRVEIVIYSVYVHPHVQALARRIQNWVMKNEIDEPPLDWAGLGAELHPLLGEGPERSVIPRDHIIQAISYVSGWLSTCEGGRYREAEKYLVFHADEIADQMIEDS